MRRTICLVLLMTGLSWPGLTQPVATGKDERIRQSLDAAHQYEWSEPLRVIELVTPIIDSLLPVISPGQAGANRIEALLLMANSEKMLSNKARSLMYVTKAVNESLQLRNDTMLVKSYYMKASIFGQYDDTDSAFVYYQKSAENFQGNISIYYLSIAHINMGNILFQIGNTAKAEEYLQKGYHLSKQDDYAWMFSLSSLITFYQKQNDPRYVAYLDTFAMSDFYKNASKASLNAHFDSFLQLDDSTPPEREKKLREVFDYSKTNSAYVNQIGYGLKLYTHYDEQKAWVQGWELLQEILPIAKKAGNGKLLANVYTAFYQNAKHRGDTKQALQYLEIAESYQDSILAAANHEMINELNIRFEVAQKDHEIEKQAQEILNAARNRRYLILLTVLGAALGVISFIYFNNRARSARQIARQADIIHQGEKQRLQKEHEVAQLSASLDSQERERNRIARDLHDGLGSLMSGISAQIENLISLQPDNEMYPPLKSIVRETAAELRRTSYELMPAKLLRMGLEPAIRDLCFTLLVKTGIEPNLELSTEPASLTHDKQLIVYRIIQELLHNIVKHAKATEVLIQLSSYNDEMTLVVEDNGQGFQLTDTMHSGIGLGSIRSRVDILNGFLDIASSPGDGTTVTINFPLQSVNSQPES